MQCGTGMSTWVLHNYRKTIKTHTIMKFKPLFVLWGLSFCVMALSAVSLNAVFFISAAAWVGLSLYMQRHWKRLDVEAEEMEKRMDRWLDRRLKG